MTHADIAIIGAGAAGIGAARAAAAAGRRAIVLEASGRIGGRAWTAHPPELDGQWFDMGAIWLHDAARNPVTPLVHALGLRLLNSAEIRQERTFVGERPASEPELADYDGAWERYSRAAERILADGGDAPLAAVAERLKDDPWALTVEAWEGPVICCADADRFSLRDWRRNALGGLNLVPEGGIGAAVAQLGQGLDIRLGTPALAVSWGGSEAQVETPNGTLRAGAVIITASTGVLRAGAIRFDPALPAETAAALEALPMGLAIKVVLRATGTDRLGLPSHTSVDHQVRQSGEPFMIFNCWPHGRDYVQGWIGASPAWELAQAGEAAVADFALAELRKLFGGRVDALFAGGARLVTRWDADPFVRGAYAYVPPGRAEARAALARPLAGGRLIFAGEACHDGYAGTVGGAWLSGEAAARAALAALAREAA
ncbi:MAG TPA: NAD(P)/FAD-dependent oxidoreductase [Acetobacteraceae bacterium]|nr:NAD(P)/FAD-dependent oxidoreductase [Acetobacteraceae bacterium]